MQKYADFSPTPFDPQGLGCDDRQDWFVAPVSKTRDSGILAKSNFKTALECLANVDPNEIDHEVHRFNHWGPGWFEIILVRPDSNAFYEAEEIEAALSNYPVLNDSDYSQRSFDAACEAWENTSIADRVKICSQHSVSIFAARRNEIPTGLPHFEDFYTEE